MFHVLIFLFLFFFVPEVFVKLCFTVFYSTNNRVFHSLYKFGRNGNFVFKGFNNSKKSYLQ